MQVLWDVDTQVDFVAADGRLAVPGAEAVRPAMRRLVEWARAEGIVHVASADDHELGDPEIADEPDFSTTYPVHCLRGTPGAERIPETRQADPLPLGGLVYAPARIRRLITGRRELLLLKKSFDVFTNPSAEAVVDALAPERIVLFGVATDVCDDAAIRGLRRRGYAVDFVEDASAGLDEARTARCLAAWERMGVRRLGVEEATA